MDFNVDDNGLWVIYGTPESNNTIIAKVIIEVSRQLLVCNTLST